MRVLLAASFSLLLALSWWGGLLPLFMPCWCLLVSLVTLVTYCRDKRAAERQAWRVPEATLQGLALSGGWPGALVGQQRFRHKTRKLSFQIVFWLMLLANTGALVWLHTAPGSQFLREIIALLTRLVTMEVSASWLRQGLLTLLAYR